ncbi:MAG: PEP-CTERM sorting domain-containing protein [Planctomycetaceae bacterium]
MTSWTLATTERVWLEGFQPNRGILWDGFVYAVGTGTADQFRYVSIIHGGPGALQRDGDNEINGVMGLTEDYTPPPNPVPEPTTWTLACLAAVVLAARHRSRRGHTATCRGATCAAS